MQMGKLIDEYKDWRSFKIKLGSLSGYDLTLRSFCVFLHNPNIEEIRVNDITLWFDLHRQLGWDDNTLIKKGVTIKKFLEYCQHQKYEVMDPWLVPMPKQDLKIPRVCAEDEYHKLLEMAKRDTLTKGARNEAIIRMLWDTGARNNEILSLNVNDMDISSKQTVIKTEKSVNRRPFRQIFWTQETSEALARWIEIRSDFEKHRVFKDSEALFISILGRKSGQRISIAGVGEFLRQYSRKCDIFPVANAHSLRHHMGQDLSNGGANNSQISSILGHSNLSSSYIYTMLNNKDAESFYRKHKAKTFMEDNVEVIHN